MMKSIRKTKNYLIFIWLILLSIIKTILLKEYLDINDLLYNYYSELLEYDQIEVILNIQNKITIIGYFLIPLMIIFRTNLVAFSISISLFIFDLEDKIKYSNILKFVFIGEFIFIIADFVRFGYFYFIKTQHTLTDIQNFYPLSALNIVGYEGLEPWFIYPFQVLNLFEVAYWILLSYLLGKELKMNIDKGFEIVASGYGIGLLIWVGAVMFFILNAS